MLLLMATVLVSSSNAARQSGSGDLAKVTEAMVVKELLCLGSLPSDWNSNIRSDRMAQGIIGTEYSFLVFHLNIQIVVTGSKVMGTGLVGSSTSSAAQLKYERVIKWIDKHVSCYMFC